MKIWSLIILLYLLALSGQAQQQLVQERSYKTKPLDTQIFGSTPDKNGNIIYSGTSVIGIRSLEHYLLKVQPNTDTLWAKKNPILFEREPQSLKSLTNGDFIFGGVIPNNNTVGISLQRFNPNGVAKWTKSYTNVPCAISAMLPLPNKDILIGGGYGSGKNFSILLTDSIGNFKAIKDHSVSGRGTIIDMNFTKSGNIIVAGFSGGSLPNTWHARLLLLNQNGDSIKGAHLAIRGPNRKEGMDYNFNSVTPLSDGGFLVTAYTDTVNAIYPAGSYMGMVVKVDSALKVQWSYIHRTPDVDEYAFTKAKELADGTILVLGFKFRPSQGGNGFQIYRFSPSGQLKNVYPFTSSICSQVWGITFDALADSTFLIGGRCGNNPPISYGFYVAKVKILGLAPVVAPFTITATKEETLLAGTTLGQSYPNPTNLEAIIPYTLPKNYNKASIIVREIATGREIRKYDLKRNSSSLTVVVSNLSSGLYLYSLVVDEKPVATKKLAVMH